MNAEPHNGMHYWRVECVLHLIVQATSADEAVRQVQAVYGAEVIETTLIGE